MKKLLLFAVCSLPAPAIAASLCVIDVNRYSYGYNAANKIWAVGVGCGERSGGDNGGNKPDAATPAELCDGAVVIHGTYDHLYGTTCSCKATWPIALFPRVYGNINATASADFCAKACGNIFNTIPGSAILL